MDNTSNQPLIAEKNWRKFFSDAILRKAEGFFQKGYVQDFNSWDNSAKAEVVTMRTSGFSVSIQTAPQSYHEDWTESCFSCNCTTKTAQFLFPEYRSVYTCAHEAAVMLYWEKQRGPWRFQEPPEEYAARMEQKRIEEERQREKERIAEEQRKARQKAEEEQERIRQEQRRRMEEKRRKEKKVRSARDFFPLPEDNTYFNVRTAVASRTTNQYAWDCARKILEEGGVDMGPPHLSFHDDGDQVLNVEADVKEGLRLYDVEVILSNQKLLSSTCACQGWYDPFGHSPLCEHVLALLTKLREYLREHNPGDATDKAADSLFQAMDALAVPAAEDTVQASEKERNLVLVPRIIMDEGEARLSFKAGFQGGKMLMLRAYNEFLDAVEEEKTFPLSKVVSVDFSKSDFTEDSLPWLRFLQRRVSETETVNEQLEQKSGRGYYGRTPALSVGVRDTLTGATLDRFYELAEGTAVEFQNRAFITNNTIRIGHMNLHVRLTAKRLIGHGSGFHGVEVTGEMPSILRGSAGSYIFNNHGLSRITKEEERFLRPFQNASDKSGKIRFRVGMDHLAEFYYRVVPRFLESPFVDFEDDCSAEAEKILPPEPAFTFRMDAEEDWIFCDALVSYGDGEPRPIRQAESPGIYRDTAQEARVERTLGKYFKPTEIQGDSRPSRFWTELTEDNLYRVLTEGVAELERFGTVLGSEAFRRSSVRPAPQFKVSVSIDSGLLDLSILSRDVDPAELLEVLESYRQKKKYHRLKSGEFVTLSGSDQLAALEDLVDGLDVTAEDVILHGAELPLYRTLYLDKLLEAHDSLVSSRDRTYRALVRNFTSIRDTDYEVPEAQGEVLRPYQVYGYKWLRTLAEAGFGGILADEMGLGKTLQTITLMQSLRENGEKGPMLVVCPASLVFNWQEEFTRFAPGLSVVPVAGTAAARKSILDELAQKGGGADTVFVTSYDLLRKDVALYEKAEFALMVLDEAQYIKNQKAAMTKAVKGIHARRRFALTGTPIENRLAELWSIFDFLMPGFLYGYTDFSRKFETPITKNKDQAATNRLKQMTGPFILRRLKTDVLKDLPAKLEEVRYSRFEEEQRKVYDGQVVRMKQMLARSGETGQDKVKIFAELMRIRQICCDPSLLLEGYEGGSAKREACLELIQNAMGGGHRMLVFSQFTSMLALLEEDLSREKIPFCKITGATPKEQRIRLVRDFNEGDTPVFLISLKAGGTGLNLTGADVVIHYDPWWNVAAQNQATDRAHRIGQTRQVTVYRMIAKDTIEEKILALQEAKRDLADAVLSGESASLASLSNEELMELLS